MIHRVFSDLPTFKNLTFQPGLNVLLAEKSPGATERQTRNRAGKTSFVDVVHFLLGAKNDPKSVFRTDELKAFNFGIEFDLNSQVVTAERSGSSPTKVRLRAPDTTGWPVAPAVGRSTFSNSNWQEVLGSLFFGLQESSEDENPAAPTFRSLFAYFARRQAAGAFTTPEKQSAMQQLGDQQMALMYLLGLDWTIARGWHGVRERERTLKELKKAAGAGIFGEVIGTVAELRTQLTVTEAAAYQLRARLEDFCVLPEYENIEREASQLTGEINGFANDNTADRQLVRDLEKSLSAETPPPLTELERLYADAGVALPGLALRRFDEVRAFHESVIHNRREYLGGEKDAAETRIAGREEKKGRLVERRAEIMRVLSTGGALQQFSQLQAELNRREAGVESLRQRFQAAQTLEGTKTELEIERAGLLRRLRQDFNEQAGLLRDAILAFEEASSSLYESAGSLNPRETDNGPIFDIRMQGDRSRGIKQMQIFCFDMMMMQLCSKRGTGPGFLIHDSHLFDGVDGRQIAAALEVGAKTAEKFGFQYIVTMNEDDAFKETRAGFDLSQYLLPMRLTDATENGGLFGIRFG